jgi:hydrogenase/urease accessory protein HupE
MIKRIVIFGFLIICITPGSVLAHSPVEGVNSFYNGILHPAFIPAHLLLLLSLGIFFAQHGLDRYRSALSVFLVATLFGLTVAWFVSFTSVDFYLLSGSVILGLLIAVNLFIADYLLLLIATFTGFCLGIDSAQETLYGMEKLVSLLGSGVGILLLLTIPLVLVDNLKKNKWQRISVRIVGSWIAASAFLVLALSISSRV